MSIDDWNGGSFMYHSFKDEMNQILAILRYFFVTGESYFALCLVLNHFLDVGVIIWHIATNLKLLDSLVGEVLKIMIH